MSAPTTTPAPTSEDAADGRSRLRTWLPWIVALAAVGLAVFSTVRWQQLEGEIGPVREAEAARAEVEAAAGTFLLELTTWDATEGLTETRDRLTELGTDDFRAEVDRLFGAELSVELKQVEATSQGEVQDLFVQRVEGDRAVVFAVVIQSQDTAQTEPDTLIRSARVTLERVDGEWKVAAVDMVDAGTSGLQEVTGGDEEEQP